MVIVAADAVVVAVVVIIEAVVDVLALIRSSFFSISSETPLIDKNYKRQSSENRGKFKICEVEGFSSRDFQYCFDDVLTAHVLRHFFHFRL